MEKVRTQCQRTNPKPICALCVNQVSMPFGWRLIATGWNSEVRCPVESIVEIYRQKAARLPDASVFTFVHDPGVDDGAHVLSHRGLDEAAQRVAAWLGEHCAPGDRVLLVHGPGMEFPAAFLGCLYAGMIAVPSSRPGRFAHERRRLTAIAHDATVSAVLCECAGLDETEKWLADSGLEIPCQATDELPAAVFTPAAVDGETIAMLQYTSGSTGSPKGVVVRHRNLVSNVDTIVRTLQLRPDQRTGSWIPLHHDMGLIGLMLPGLIQVGGYVQMDPMAFLRRPAQWLRMLDRYDISATASPDFGYELCVRRVTDEQLADVDLSKVGVAVCGSEPVRATTMRAFNSRFAAAGWNAETLVPMYGLAESTLLVSGTLGRPPLVAEVDTDALAGGILQLGKGKELVSCGRPQDTDLRIFAPETVTELPEGIVGEICLAGPSVTSGYWKREEFGEYLRTGDLGALMGGEIFVTGRIKDLMVLHGRNVHPHDVEQELRMRYAELEGLQGAVFSIPDPERLVVVHEIRAHWGPERLDELLSEITQFVAREFGAAPAVLLVRPGAVRRTTSGKVQRSAMRELFLRRELEPLAVSD
ncbi:fatty acyl-AMP ligase [Kribbella sp. NPDC051587]|uniref:fatty acyl-AMP ligase n=1 Tax=Kribbella sp. NPDC051587 TaxID=3364119 RepID=UPI00379E894F